MKTLNAIRKTLLQLEAKRRSLLDEMLMTADLALPLHPWQKNQGKFVQYRGGLWRVESLACSVGMKGDLLFLVYLHQCSQKLRRPLKTSNPLRLNICHLEGCEVLP